jgi:hypothetical protein
LSPSFTFDLYHFNLSGVLWSKQTKWF